MTDLAISILFAIVSLFVLLWLARGRVGSPKTARSLTDLEMESILPRHYRFFPQVRQALSVSDGEYLRECGLPDVARTTLRERRAVARQFLFGLYEDFSNLERLARMIATLSPVISRQQETERIVLGLRFRWLYFWVWLRISTGRAPLGQIADLTALVGRLATRMEQAMAAISALSAPGLDSGPSA
jgi:hypothetical protein